MTEQIKRYEQQITEIIMECEEIQHSEERIHEGAG